MDKVIGKLNESIFEDCSDEKIESYEELLAESIEDVADIQQFYSLPTENILKIIEKSKTSDIGVLCKLVKGMDENNKDDAPLILRSIDSDDGDLDDYINIITSLQSCPICKRISNIIERDKTLPQYDYQGIIKDLEGEIETLKKSLSSQKKGEQNLKPKQEIKTEQKQEINNEQKKEIKTEQKQKIKTEQKQEINNEQKQEKKTEQKQEINNEQKQDKKNEQNEYLNLSKTIDDYFKEIDDDIDIFQKNKGDIGTFSDGPHLRELLINTAKDSSQAFTEVKNIINNNPEYASYDSKYKDAHDRIKSQINSIIKLLEKYTEDQTYTKQMMDIEKEIKYPIKEFTLEDLINETLDSLKERNSLVPIDSMVEKVNNKKEEEIEISLPSTQYIQRNIISFDDLHDLKEKKRWWDFFK